MRFPELWEIQRDGAHVMPGLHQSRSEQERGAVQRGGCGECELDSF